VATFLITGVAGFIGSSLARGLLAKGYRVRGIDNFATGRRENLSDLPGLDFREVDIVNAADLNQHFEGCDWVLHQAAIPSVPRSLEDPLRTHLNNATGTLNVLETARRVPGIRRVVCACSSSAYGDVPEAEKVETLKPVPLSPYAVSKLCGEYYAQVYARLCGVETVCLRYFNVFGPHQDPAGEYAAVIPKFVERALKGLPIPVHGDGGQTRDFTFIDNVVEANELAAFAPGVSGEVFNIACGRRISLLDVIKALQQHLGGAELAVEHLPSRAGDVRDSLADISKAQSRLGYRVNVDFEVGLGKVVAWHRRAGAGG
jgi:nucleoside-diphosphate-sugar epimerase